MRNFIEILKVDGRYIGCLLRSPAASLPALVLIATSPCRSRGRAAKRLMKAIPKTAQVAK